MFRLLYYHGALGRAGVGGDGDLLLLAVDEDMARGAEAAGEEQRAGGGQGDVRLTAAVIQRLSELHGP